MVLSSKAYVALGKLELYGIAGKSDVVRLSGFTSGYRRECSSHSTRTAQICAEHNALHNMSSIAFPPKKAIPGAALAHELR